MCTGLQSIDGLKSLKPMEIAIDNVDPEPEKQLSSCCKSKWTTKPFEVLKCIVWFICKPILSENWIECTFWYLALLQIFVICLYVWNLMLKKRSIKKHSNFRSWCSNWLLYLFDCGQCLEAARNHILYFWHSENFPKFTFDH